MARVQDRHNPPRPPAPEVPIKARQHVHWDPATELIVDEEKTLLCPICKEPYRKNQIFQCPDGHLFCGPCACIKVRECPNRMCRRKISSWRTIRNRRLESILEDSPHLLAISGLARQHPPVRTSSREVPEGQGPSTPNPDHNPANGIVGACQYCYKTLSPFGARFKCLVCRESNICQTCVSLDVHPDKHPLILIMTPKQSAKATELIAIRATSRVHRRRRGPVPMEPEN